MAQVPYAPSMDQAANSTPSPGGARLSVANISPDAFGAGVARQGEAIGNMLWQEANRRQDLLNTAEANDLDVQAMEKIGQLQTNFYSKQGKEAIDAYPAYQQAVQAVRNEVLGSTANPAVRRATDMMLTKRVGFALVDGGRHTAQQQKVYVNKTADSKIALAQQSAIGADETRFQDNLSDIEKTIRETHPEWSEETTKLEIQKQQGAAWVARLTYTAMSNPFVAMQAFQANKDKIDPNTAMELEPKLQQLMVTHGSRMIANNVVAGGAGYFDTLYQKERGGKDFKADGSPNNPSTSSAQGKYQFTTGTWEAVKKQHPELNLGDINDNAEQEKAIRAFTADNAAALLAKGLPATEKNLYMMHFLGSGGGPKFLKGLAENPDAPATDYVDAAQVRANRSVFYYPDGSAKSVQAVYEGQTGKFKDAVYGSSVGDLSGMVAAGRAAAAAAMPEDKYGVKSQELQDAVEQRIRAKFNSDVSIARDENIASTLKVNDALYGTGKLLNAEEWEAAKNNDPEVAKAFNSLPAKQQNAVIKAIELGTRQEANLDTPERAELLENMKGLAIMSPKVFMQKMTEELATMDLTNTGKQRLTQIQRKIQENSVADPVMSGYMTYLKQTGAFDGTGLSLSDPSGKNTRLHRFVGQLTDLVANYKLTEKQDPTNEVVKGMAAKLLAKQGTNWYGGLSGPLGFEQNAPVTPTNPKGEVQVPADQEQKIIDWFARNNRGQMPTGAQIRQIYTKALTSGLKEAK